MLAVIGLIMAMLFPQLRNSISDSMDESLANIDESINEDMSKAEQMAIRAKQIEEEQLGVTNTNEETNSSPNAVVDEQTDYRNGNFIDDSDNQTIEKTFETIKSALIIVLTMIATILIIIAGFTFLPGLIRKQKNNKTLKDKKKNAFRIMDDIYKKGINKYFKIDERRSHFSSYSFEKNNYHFKVELNKHLLSAKVSIGNDDSKQLLYFVHNLNSNEFQTKNVSNRYIENETNDLKSLKKFIYKIVKHDWSNAFEFNLIDEDNLDINDEEMTIDIPDVSSAALQQEIIEIEKEIQEKILNEESKSNFMSITEMIEDLHNKMDEIDEFDYETQHIVEYSIKNDLNNLLSIYSELSGEAQDSIESELSERLNRIENKIKSVYEKIESKKLNEIKRIFNVIDNRYDDNKTS